MIDIEHVKIETEHAISVSELDLILIAGRAVIARYQRDTQKV